MSPLQEAAPEACSSPNRLRTALLVNLAAVLERCDEQMVPAVYRFIGAAFDATPTQLGYITLSRALVQALSAPLGGIAGHCLHRGRVIGCGCILWSACTAAFAGCHSLGAGAAIWGLNGLGLALVLPNSQSLTADLFVAGQRGRAFGCLYLTAALGGMLGAVWATNIGSHRPLGMEGWRFAFLSLACVSAATGVANMLLATDPLRDQPPLSAAHAFSKSGRVSAAELELLQPGSMTGAATGQQLAPRRHGESEAEALSRRQPHDSASSSCARQQPALAGSFPASQGSQNQQRWSASMAPAARQIAADIWSVLRIPTFGIIVAQGIMGSIPWSALVFLTLYFQLLGMSDAQASSLVAIFLAGTAFGGLIGGCVGDAAAKLYPHHGRIAVTQAKAGRALPLAIMTSDDTHARTEALLKDNAYWGASANQITLIKQEKVACLSDNDAHLALLDKEGVFEVQTKPHGHGDVHMLLHTSGLADKWQGEGFKWVCFFQDTNALVFRALPAAIGVSVAHDYDVNSLAVPRKAKESIGAITRLTHPDGRTITINVEYNQLDPLLRATTNPAGDVNDDTHYSPFPGNINQLVLKLSTYTAELHRHGGVIAEFVNPKYADASKTTFKSSTRLECMMQDFPKNLPEGSKVGFTVVNQVWAAYSPVKNSPADAAAKGAGGNPSHSATSAELDWYETNCKMLQMLGATVDGPLPAQFNGLNDLQLWPRVTWTPLFACCWDDLEAKVTAEDVRIGADSALVIEAPQARIKSLELKRGALIIRGSGPAGPAARRAARGEEAAGAEEGAKAGAGAAAAGGEGEVVVEDLSVENEGWEWAALGPDEGCAEEEYIRGFRVLRHGQKVI